MEVAVESASPVCVVALKNPAGEDCWVKEKSAKRPQWGSPKAKKRKPLATHSERGATKRGKPFSAFCPFTLRSRSVLRNRCFLVGGHDPEAFGRSGVEAVLVHLLGSISGLQLQDGVEQVDSAGRARLLRSCYLRR